MWKTAANRITSESAKTEKKANESGSPVRTGAQGVRAALGGSNEVAPLRRLLPKARTSRRPADGLSTIPSPLGNNGFIVEKFTVAPSPSRDYYGLRVAKGQLSLYVWKISHSPKLSKLPIQHRASVGDFVNDHSLKGEVKRIFGDATLSEVLAVASGSSNTLATLPTKMLLQVLQYLQPRDVLRLSQVSSRLHEVCGNNDLWEHLYKQRSRRPVGNDDRQLAAVLGWRTVFLRRGLLAENSISNKARQDSSTTIPRKQFPSVQKISTPKKSTVSVRSSMSTKNMASSSNLEGKQAQFLS